MVAMENMENMADMVDMVDMRPSPFSQSSGETKRIQPMTGTWWS